MANFKNIFGAAMLGCLAVNVQGQITRNQIGGGELNTITTSVPFLMISPDSRAGGMGDAGVASSPDANSMHWNPAKYAFIDKDMGFSMSYVPWLRRLVPDISLSYLTGYKKIGKDQVVAGSLRYFSLGDITFTDINGNTTGQFRPNEFAFDAGYSRKLSKEFSGGIAFRYIYSNLTNGQIVGGNTTKPGQTVAADVAGYYTKDGIKLGDKKGKINAGLNISNIGGKIRYSDAAYADFIPINMKLGGGLTVNLDDYNSFTFLLDVNKLLVPTSPIYEVDAQGQIVRDADNNPIVAQGVDPNRPVPAGMFGSFSDAPGGGKEELREFYYSTGVEYWYDNLLAVRGGFFYEHPTKGNRKYATLGLGLRYNAFGLDFSYLIPTTQNNPLQNTLRFTLVFNFDKAQKADTDATTE